MGDRPLLERPPHRRYFVVITRGASRWWDRFLSDGQTHCFLLVWDEFVFLSLNPTTGITEVSLIPMPGNKFDDPLNWLDDPDAEVIEAELEYDERMRVPWVFSPFTCVEVVKSCLGIRRFWVWTPAQLRRYIAGRSARRHGYGW